MGMDDLVTGATGSLISKLGELLKEEYNLQNGVKEQVETLSRELESAHAALRKVGEVPADGLDEQVRIWAREVREASYDMEDVLDDFLVNLKQSGHEYTDHEHESLLQHLRDMVAGLFTVMGSLFKRRKIVGAIGDIRKKLQEVADRRGRYRVDDIGTKQPEVTSTIDPRLASMYKDVTQLVGIDKSSGELISMMLSKRGDVFDNNKMKIFSIVGAGGLGKTTLARVVYEKLKSQFSGGAFVPVGRNPDLRKIFRDILIDLDKNTYMDLKFTKLDERQLINELQDFLRTKRYFIVIDDIWETKSWETIKFALVENNSGSRVIVTTRKLQVAIGDVYNLQPLSYDNSKKLFYARIFGGEGKCPDDHLVDVSKKILKKCDGVPLAIITMASLLVGKSRDEWYEIYSSIDFAYKDSQQLDTTKKILSLSYYDLPSHLKTCLLYLSAFPEDYFIEKGSLIEKWIAEGFVNKQRGIGLLELGEVYLHDLINRCMIQMVELDYGCLHDLINRRMIREDESEYDTLFYYPTYGCRVHDMVLDLIRSLSREENFVTLSENGKGALSGNYARRLALHDTTIDYTHKDNRMDISQVRSIIACWCHIYERVPYSRFQFLRVLALEHCRHKEGRYHLDHLGKLLHLRYLGLRHTPIFELPKDIGSLKFLQTLDLDATGIEELPTSIGQLTQLICLCARDTRMPNGIIEKLTSLEQLQIKPVDVVKSRDPFVKELRNLSELRVLRINNNELDVKDNMQSDLLQSLGSLHKLQILILDGWFIRPEQQSDKEAWDTAVLPQHLRHLILPSVWFYGLPYCIKASSLPCLSHLFLNVCDMDEGGLRILGELPELRYLYLTTLSTVALTITIADRCFQKLRSCLFDNSTVQIVLHEDTRSVSLCLWNGSDGVNLSRCKKDSCRVAAPAVMPNLEVLDFKVQVQGLMHDNSICNNLGLEHITSLKKVKVRLCCDGALSEDVEKEKAALRHAVEAHPNQPTIEVQLWKEDRIKRCIPAHMYL
ncbi:unnamed protein product [Urochloa decumbens]|uniref:Uncharacterized protein n=1 Tax=Urochloa decumbens TaxID=240449 RepID=A0ABC9GVC3_9POAL